MKLTRRLLSVFLVLVLLLAFSMVASAEEAEKTITVHGWQNIKLKPDMANVNFSVQTREKTQVKALEENNKKMNTIIKAFKDFGIKEEDILTEGVRIDPIYNYEKGQVLEGYRAYNSITVKLKNLDKLGKVLDLGMRSGVDEGGYIEYSSTKERETYLKALELAIKDGEEKAKIIGKTLGAKNVSIKSVREKETYYASRNYTRAMAEETKDASGILVDIKDLVIEASVEIDFKF